LLGWLAALDVDKSGSLDASELNGLLSSRAEEVQAMSKLGFQ
jgi:hypothetical protein